MLGYSMCGTTETKEQECGQADQPSAAATGGAAARASGGVRVWVKGCGACGLATGSCDVAAGTAACGDQVCACAAKAPL